MTDYNGWKDKATWNCAMWLNNDEALYRRAVSYAQQYKKDMSVAGVQVISTLGLWFDFIEDAGLLNAATPDNWSWRAADPHEMGKLLVEMGEEE